MAEQPSPNNPFLGSQSQPAIENPPIGSEDSSPALGAPDSAPGDQYSAGPMSLPVEQVATPRSRWRHRVVRRVGIAFLVAIVLGAVMYWWFRDVGDVSVVSEAPKPAVETSAAAPPALAPDTGTLALPDDSANYESENFKAGEIVIGGELQFLVDEDEVGPLTVENIRGEAFTEKNKQEVKLVVTWTTSKLSQASVRYSKGIGQTERAVDETDYSYNHSVIISGLDSASTYLYTIDALDRYGNRVKSEPHAVFTGARTVSLFDLIAGAIGEVFGWAVTNK